MNASRAKWAKDGDPHPEQFTGVSPQEAAGLTTSGCFFARKFAPDSGFERFGLHLPAAGEATLTAAGLP